MPMPMADGRLLNAASLPLGEVYTQRSSTLVLVGLPNFEESESRLLYIYDRRNLEQRSRLLSGINSLGGINSCYGIKHSNELSFRYFTIC